MGHTKHEKKMIVEQTLAAVRQGASVNSCAAQAGVAPATLGRWIKAYENGGLGGLERKSGSGRVSQFALTKDQEQALKRYVLETDSRHLSIRLFADDPRCPDDLREYILERAFAGKDYAPSLYRAAHVTEEARAKFRGNKAWTYAGKLSRRGTHEVMPDGTEREIEPGDWWEFDDMSWNQPFWFEVPAGTGTRDGKADRCAEKYGCSLGRQSLMAMDLRSGKWLGLELIGRSRDAYRSEDILRFMRRLFEEYGKPRRGVRLERGIWRSKALRGEKVQLDEEETALVGGLQEMGLEVSYAYTSGQKGNIESGFDHLQSIAGTLHARNIGRVRGEMEADTKAMLQTKRGQMHPRDAGFPYITDFLTMATECLVFANGELKQGRIQSGIPDEVWSRAVSAGPLDGLRAEDYPVFFPERRELTITRGTVETKVDGQPLWFSNPEIFAVLGTGYRVVVAFDPGEPTAGCAVYNRETGARAHQGHLPGQLICLAEYDEAGPQFGGDGSALGIERRKAFKNAVAAAYSGTGIFGRRKVRAIEARDGRGNVARQISGPGVQDQIKTPQDGEGNADDAFPVVSTPRPSSAQRAGRGGLDPAIAALMEEDDF